MNSSDSLFIIVVMTGVVLGIIFAVLGIRFLYYMCRNMENGGYIMSIVLIIFCVIGLFVIDVLMNYLEVKVDSLASINIQPYIISNLLMDRL